MANLSFQLNQENTLLRNFGFDFFKGQLKPGGVVREGFRRDQGEILNRNQALLAARGLFADRRAAERAASRRADTELGQLQARQDRKSQSLSTNSSSPIRMATFRVGPDAFIAQAVASNIPSQQEALTRDTLRTARTISDRGGTPNLSAIRSQAEIVRFGSASLRGTIERLPTRTQLTTTPERTANREVLATASKMGLTSADINAARTNPNFNTNDPSSSGAAGVGTGSSIPLLLGLGAAALFLLKK